MFKPMPIKLKRGEAVFHHPLAVHGSLENKYGLVDDSADAAVDGDQGFGNDYCTITKASCEQTFSDLRDGVGRPS